jgi:Rha family phage regulatory protein
MNEITDLPAVTLEGGVPTTTSLEVARFFGKDHAKVLRDIRLLIEQCEAKFCGANFGLTSFVINMPHGGTREEPAYRLTRDGFTLLAMGFTGKRALAFKLAYIEAFNALEAERARPLTVPARLSLVQYRVLRQTLLDCDQEINRLFAALDAACIECTADEIEQGFFRPPRS